MSILNEIDDVLTDWNGSADSMEWRPDGASELRVTFDVDTSAITAALARAAEAVAWLGTATAAALGATKEMFALTAEQPEPRPPALDARYHRRYRNRQGRR